MVNATIQLALRRTWTALGSHAAVALGVWVATTTICALILYAEAVNVGVLRDRLDRAHQDAVYDLLIKGQANLIDAERYRQMDQTIAQQVQSVIGGDPISPPPWAASWNPSAVTSKRSWSTPSSPGDTSCRSVTCSTSTWTACAWTCAWPVRWATFPPSTRKTATGRVALDRTTHPHRRGHRAGDRPGRRRRLDVHPLLE